MPCAKTPQGGDGGELRAPFLLGLAATAIRKRKVLTQAQPVEDRILPGPSFYCGQVSIGLVKSEL